MNVLFHQTKQAFLFSLGFYLSALALAVLGVSFAPVIFSISLLVSLIWTILVIKEILLSNFTTRTEKMLLIFFIIFLNILAGIVYFYFLREKVLGIKKIKK